MANSKREMLPYTAEKKNLKAKLQQAVHPACRLPGGICINTTEQHGI